MNGDLKIINIAEPDIILNNSCRFSPVKIIIFAKLGTMCAQNMDNP